MIKFILGAKGSGKTKWLVDNANKDREEGLENIVFIDVDDEHIFTLDRDVRLVNAMEFNINSIESFYGFLCGILAKDYDVEKVYVDSLYKVVDIGEEELEYLTEKLSNLPEVLKTKFYMNVNYVMEDIPEKYKDISIEVENIEL